MKTQQWSKVSSSKCWMCTFEHFAIRHLIFNSNTGSVFVSSRPLTNVCCWSRKEIISIVLTERSPRPAAFSWRPSFHHYNTQSFIRCIIVAAGRQMRRRWISTCDDGAGRRSGAAVRAQWRDGVDGGEWRPDGLGRRGGGRWPGASGDSTQRPSTGGTDRRGRGRRWRRGWRARQPEVWLTVPLVRIESFLCAGSDNSSKKMVSPAYYISISFTSIAFISCHKNRNYHLRLFVFFSVKQSSVLPWNICDCFLSDSLKVYEVRQFRL